MKEYYILPTERPSNFGAIRLSADRLLKIANNHLEEKDKFLLLLNDNNFIGNCTRLITGTLKEIKEYINNESNKN